MYENLLRPTEYESDLDSLLTELTVANKIHNQFGWIHIISPQSEERRKNPKKNSRVEEANPWAWYACLPESVDFRDGIRRTFTKEDGRVFKALAAIIGNERSPRVGTRVVGPITEEEGRYITKVNEALYAYKDRMKES